MTMPRYAIVTHKQIDDLISKEIETGRATNYKPVLDERVGTFVSGASISSKDRIWFKGQFWKVDMIFHQEVVEDNSIRSSRDPIEAPIDAIILIIEDHMFQQREIPEAFKPEKWPARG